jgi:hypothetical protein
MLSKLFSLPNLKTDGKLMGKLTESLQKKKFFYRYY